MKVLMINPVCGIGSTGRICADLAVMLEARGHDVKIAYGRGIVPERYQKYAVKIGGKLDAPLHALKARLADATGFGSKAATKCFIRWVKEFDPDVIHLHNLHGYYVNLDVLFAYLRSCGKPILWSFYDCWSFTGHCAHFDYNQCNKWKNGCHDCANLQEYPQSYLNRSAKNFQKKQRLFTNIPNLQLILPSGWMQRMVEQSYMQAYPTHLLPNGIDLQMFQENNLISKIDLGIGNKCMVLGVSSVWSKTKGIEDIISITKKLPQADYQIVLAGQLPSSVRLPENVIHIERTHDITQLCSYYSAADVFINPTLQETQGLTTVEALACGTPAIIYNSGGAPECLDDTCGIVVPRGDVDGMIQALEDIRTGKRQFSPEDCKAAAQKYSKDDLYQPFLALYARLTNGEEK